MTNRNTRLAIIVTVAVLVIGGVALGAYLYGRSTTAEPTPSPTGSSTPTAGPSASYEPTDPNGSPESGLSRGQAEAGAGGSTVGPASLPLGYTHDETGAVNAATNYLMWMNSLKIVDEDTARSLAGASAADKTTRAALLASFDALRPGMREMTADQPEPARGAYAVAGYTADRALIYIWSPEVMTDSSGRTEHLWGIDAVTVVWSDGDWKLSGGLITKTGAAAVDPVDPAGNPTAAEKHSVLARTPGDPGEITDSASQSWFEYANAPG